MESVLLLSDGLGVPFEGSRQLQVQLITLENENKYPEPLLSLILVLWSYRISASEW